MLCTNPIKNLQSNRNVADRLRNLAINQEKKSISLRGNLCTA